MRIDQLMISQIIGDHATGIYSAAVRISEVFYIIPTILTSVFYPSIINAKKYNTKLYYLRLQRLMTFLVWIAIISSVIIIPIRYFIVIFLFGKDYIEASSILVINIWTGVFVSMGVASGAWYTNENLQKYSFYRTFFGAVINVILNLLLIPAIGIVGAAISTLVAQVFATFLFDFLTKKTRIMFYMKLKSFYFSGLS
jgi:O-antigen/teichoic acid export membrane protein